MLGYNNRLYTLIFTSGLAVLSTSVVLLFFYTVGLHGVLPVLPSYLLAIAISIIWGLVFHKQILKHKSKTHSFLLGVILLLLSLPLFDLGAIYFIKDQFQGTQLFHANLSEYVTLYVMIVIYSVIFIGSWLSVLCGLASMILRHHLILFDTLVSSSTSTS